MAATREKPKVGHTFEGMVSSYVLTKKVLGEGTYSVVRLAEHSLNPETKVAVKIFEKYEEDLDIDKRINTEVRILLSLQHENIIKAIYQETNLLPHMLVLELAEVNLHRYLQDNSTTLTLKQKLHFLNEALSAVIYIHNQSILHRDLKPGNFLIGSDGHLKLSDFGFACYYDPVKGLHYKDGSPVRDFEVCTYHYAAWELMLGVYKSNQSILNKATDMWSMGVIAIELMLAELPFYHKLMKGKQGYFAKDRRVIRASVMCCEVKNLIDEFIKDDATYSMEPLREMVRLCLSMNDERPSAEVFRDAVQRILDNPAPPPAPKSIFVYVPEPPKVSEHSILGKRKLEESGDVGRESKVKRLL